MILKTMDTDTQLDRSAVTDLVSAFLRGRSPATISAYRTNLEHFTRHVQAENSNTAARQLLSHGPGHANLLTLKYRNTMVDAEIAPNTINQKLATLRSLCKLARTIGLITWVLEVDSVKTIPYRDTRGPRESGFRKMIDLAETRRDEKGIRDYTILRLLHDLALRRGEVAALNIEDLDSDSGHPTILVRGKGTREKVGLHLPERTLNALLAWICLRGTKPGPMFTNLHKSDMVRGSRLTPTSIYRIVQKIGKSAKLDRHVTPHGLRHTAITRAVAKCQGARLGIDAVQQFSRHANLNTVQIYIDRYEDRQGKVAEMVAE